MAVAVAVTTAMTLRKRFVGKKILSFVYQFPLTIPHLVAAVGVLMLVSQSGLLARTAFQIGLISDSSQFPILVFDDLGIGIILVYIWKEVPFIGLIALAIGSFQLLAVIVGSTWAAWLIVAATYFIAAIVIVAVRVQYLKQ